MADRRTLPWGSRVELVAGRPTRVLDRAGNETHALHWADETLKRARLRLPSGRQIVLETDVGEHPLFGRVDRIRTEGDASSGVVLAAVRWASPDFIPPLDRPGALPSGAGTAVLNLLARRAADAGIATIRYCGPYPTAALFETLRASFRVSESLHEAAARFSADVERLAVRGQMHENPVDFVPAPHEWLFAHPRVCIQARDAIERVYVDGRPHGHEDFTLARLRDEGDTLVATLEVAGHRWAELVRLDRTGALLEGPHPVPEIRSPLVGLELPRSVVDVLAEAACSRAPTMLRASLRELFATRKLRFADTGPVLARRSPEAIEINAMLGERLDTMDPRTQLAWLLNAVEPVARRWAQDTLANLAPDRT